MKYWVFVLFWVTHAEICWGQSVSQTDNQFSGQIILKSTNSDYTDFSILLLSNSKKYSCSKEGKFEIASLYPGKHIIKISSLGFQTISREITIPGSGQFLLEELTTELDQVVVTAVTGNTKLRRTPISIAIVSEKEMKRSIGTNIIDVLLKSVTGISALTTGPNISKPFIRGLGYNRVLTLYDGIRQEGQQWGDEHGIEIDQYAVSHAEIVKGPASLLYGSDAIAGVINLLPGIPMVKDGKVTGDFLTEYHSNNGLIGTSISLENNKNGFLWNIRASLKMATDYRNAVDGWVYNTGYKENILSGMMGWEKEKGKNYFHVNFYNNLQEIPDGSRDSLTRQFTYQTEESDKDDIKNRNIVPIERFHSYQTSTLHQNIQHIRMYHKGVYQLGQSTLNTLLGFQQNIRKEYNHPTQPNQAGLFVRLQTLNYEAKYSFPKWLGINFTGGINGMYQKNKNQDATDFPIPDYQLFDIGSFLTAKKEINKWVISGGIRFDNRLIQWKDFFIKEDPLTGFTKQVIYPDTAKSRLAFSAFQQQLSGFSGCLGIVYNISNNLTLKSNISRGYRSPSIPEIGSDGLDPGARIYYIGNRNFIPEFNWQTDIGIFLNYPNFDFQVELFNNTITNYIFLQKLYNSSGQPLEIVPGNFTYQYKQGSAQLFGIDIAMAWHPKTLPWFTLQQNISAIKGINTDNESLKMLGEDAKYLPLIPPLKTVSRVRLNLFQQKKAPSEYFLQTEIETAAEQNNFYAVDNTETKTNAYYLVNAGGGFTIVSKKDKPLCKLSLQINNLFNIAYQSHQSRLKYFEYFQTSSNAYSGIYQMGRNVVMKVVFNW